MDSKAPWDHRLNISLTPLANVLAHGRFDLGQELRVQGFGCRSISMCKNNHVWFFFALAGAVFFLGFGFWAWGALGP